MLRDRVNRSRETAHQVGPPNLTASPRRSERIGVARFLAAALIAFAIFGIWTDPALAVLSHAFTGVTIGPGGKAVAGEFTDLASVSADPSNGNIYVLDTAGKGRLYRFDSGGEPLDFSATGTNFVEGTGGYRGNNVAKNQIAIAPPGAVGGTAGDIYVANDEVLKIYSPAGLEIGQITVASKDTCGVAIDPAGNVFTKSELATSKPVVRKYAPTTNPPTSADQSGSQSIPIQERCNLAVDSKDHIYAAGVDLDKQSGQPLAKLESLTAETSQLFDPHSSAVGVESVTDNVYVSHGTSVVEYTETGSVVTEFGEGRLVEVPGVSVSGAGGNVYVANSTANRESGITLSGRVEVFGPVVVLPKAVAGVAGTISKTSAVLHGTIDAEGGPQVTCEFQYTTQATFEVEGFDGAPGVTCLPPGPFTGASVEPVSAEITGLAVGTKYRFRIVGENENGQLGSDENGSSPGQVPSFETLPAFNVQTGTVANLGTTFATLNGSINPEGVSVTECFFEYGVTNAYGASAPCEAPGGGEVGAGNVPVPVHANVPGLAGSTEYHYRLVGGTSEFGGIKVRGVDVAFGTLGRPEVLMQSLSGVSQTTAIILGTINPHSVDTHYFVEYVSDAAYEANIAASLDPFTEATRAPPQGVDIGSGFVGLAVTQTLSGLIPGTKYHFRLSAENSLGRGEGSSKVFTTHVVGPLFPSCPANEAFRVEWSAALPDCRAYEQASPTDKNGDSVAGLYPLMFAAEDGSAVTFYSPAGAVPPAERGGTQTYSTYLASRDAAAESWSSQRLLPPEEFGDRSEYLGSTPDFRYAVVEAGSVYEIGLFVIDTESGTVSTIVPRGPKGAEERNNEFGFDGASADGSRIFFESTATIGTTPKEPAPAAGHDNIYMWERSTGDVSLVGVLPASEGGKAPPAGSFGGPYEWYEVEDPTTGGTLNKPGSAEEPLAVAGLHAIAPTGEQMFFTSADTGQLYLRRGLGGPNPVTTYISTPNSGVGSIPGKQPAAFLEATPDGSRAFFMSREKLTADANTGPEEHGRDLYRWNASAPASEALTDVTPDPGGPNGAEVQGLLGVTPSGSAGFFIARGDLAEGGELGEENLYRFTERANGHFRITFVAILAEGDGTAPDRRNVSPKAGFGFPLGKTSRLSEDGDTLLFASVEPITGYENFNPEGISCEAGGCSELYVYSARTGKVTCVSCDPTGQAPLGAASLQDQFFNAYFTPNEAPAVLFSRNLSADGTKVFFQTPDPLVSRDENANAACVAFGGQPGKRNLVGPGRCQDVYEWEAAGSGSCKAAEVNGGCLYLLSTGQSGQPSYFVGGSKDGSSAFIATDSQLVPADRDQAADVYDVREGGGLASQHAGASIPCSSAEACKGSGTLPPPPVSPATPSFQGPGNLKSKACKKGSVAKNGKCVKKPVKHQKKKAKKHHKKAKRATGKNHSGGAK